MSYLFGVLIMMQVLGAMTTININRLIHGAFSVYIEQFLGKYFGFFLGWIVFTNKIFALASEALAMVTIVMILPWREISTDKSPFVQAFQVISLY